MSPEALTIIAAGITLARQRVERAVATRTDPATPTRARVSGGVMVERARGQVADLTADGGDRACPVGHQALGVAQLLRGHDVGGVRPRARAAFTPSSTRWRRRLRSISAKADWICTNAPEHPLLWLPRSGQRRLGYGDAGPRTGVTPYRDRLRPTWCGCPLGDRPADARPWCARLREMLAFTCITKTVRYDSP